MGGSDGLEYALNRIANWSRAYPLEAFPKPDLAKAAEVLSAAGMTLDAISADAMRHVIERVGKIADEALIERVRKQTMKIQVIEFKSQHSRFAVINADGDAELGNWIIALTWWREHADRIAGEYMDSTEIERLRSALKPFADVATGRSAAGSIMPDCYDAARAALGGDV